MYEIGLQFPVHTRDGQMLLPAGTLLNPEVMQSFLDETARQDWESIPVLSYGTIRPDLLYFIGHPPYEIVFGGEGRVRALLQLMEEVRLPVPLLDIVERFRIIDFYTYRHLLLVFALTALLSHELLDDPEERLLQLAASPTHDVGKICVPVEILQKPASLTPPERQVLKHHAGAGYVLVSYYMKDADVLSALVARDHHERLDGSGYPQGSIMDNLLVEVVVVADIYDALMSPRPYRLAPYEKRTALEVLTTMADKGKLRGDVVETLILLNRRQRLPDGAERRISREKRGPESPEGSYRAPFGDPTDD